MSQGARVNIQGVGIDALTLQTAIAQVISRGGARGGSYVCFCDVNSVCSARRDEGHRRRLADAWLVTPDGMPLVWLCHRARRGDVTRVYGPDVLEGVCAATAGTALTHYFYGAGPGTAEALAAQLQARFPGLRVVGTESPPFREPTEAELDDLAGRLRILRPSFFWVGLSTPKQERFMARCHQKLDTGLMLGVGAAFDFLSGNVRQAPRWVQRSGFEWLFRLAMEPRRLAPRYFRNNPLFLLRAALQLTGLRNYPLLETPQAPRSHSS